MKHVIINNLTHSNQVTLFDYWRIADSIKDFSASFEEGTVNGIIGGWMAALVYFGREN